MLKQNLFLLLTAFIWGFDFVAQHVAMNSIGPAYFIFLRFTIAGLILLVVSLIQNKKEDDKEYIKYGLILGVVLFFGAYFQQCGLVTITPGKSGFISALYIVFVPILTMFVDKERKPSIRLWIGVALALFGLYLLTFKADSLIEKGDLITVASAFVYAIQILIIDRHAYKLNVYKLNCVQFFTAALLGILFMPINHEVFSLSAIKDCLWPLLYVGVIGTCVSYTTQTIGQIGNDPTVASLIMSLESVFAALSGFIILHNVFTGKELIGCIIIFIAIIFVQIPSKKN